MFLGELKWGNYTTLVIWSLIKLVCIIVNCDCLVNQCLYSRVGDPAVTVVTDCLVMFRTGIQSLAAGENEHLAP